MFALRSPETCFSHTARALPRALRRARHGAMTQPLVSSSSPAGARDVPHAEAAWAWWHSMGAPKYWVAPMVDQSELAFRMLCRRYGATAAYTPMLHARLFRDGPAYRAEHFTTCTADRPLLAQFCANDPDVLLEAARHVAASVDGIDLNLGCPQHIARRGKYGAYLMEDWVLVESLVHKLSTNLDVPITVKIRIFADVERTVAYARMLEAAGASLVAVHGRTIQQKRSNESLADWSTIAAVKRALRVPVLANGNIRTMADAAACLEATGADGILSAETLLVDPALFCPQRALRGQAAPGPLDGARLLLEYFDAAEEHGPTPFRMVKGHTFKLLGPWLAEHVDLRETLNRGENLDIAQLRELTRELIGRVEACGRDHPIPKLTDRKRARMEADAAREASIAEQQREEDAVAALDAAAAAAAPGGEGAAPGGDEGGERSTLVAAA